MVGSTGNGKGKGGGGGGGARGFYDFMMAFLIHSFFLASAYLLEWTAEIGEVIRASLLGTTTMI